MGATPIIPRIPRVEWNRHPHYPGHVLLLNSHEAFRRTSQSLIEAAEPGADLGRIGLYFGMWISGMRRHEAYEEHKLYPYLARFHGLRVAPLVAGHEALHEAERLVRRALEGAGDLRETLVSHDGVLRSHLELEEDAIVPLLLEMTGSEFNRFVSAPIHRLLEDG